MSRKGLGTDRTCLVFLLLVERAADRKAGLIVFLRISKLDVYVYVFVHNTPTPIPRHTHNKDWDTTVPFDTTWVAL